MKTAFSLRVDDWCLENFRAHTERVLFRVEDVEKRVNPGKGSPVIFHNDGEVVAGPCKGDIDVPGRGMFDGIVDELLDDAQKVKSIFFVDGRFGAGLREVDGVAAGSFHVLAEGADADLEGIVFHVDRHETAGDAAHGFYDLEKVSVHAGDEHFSLNWIMPGPVKAVEVEAQDGQTLDKVVMQVGTYFRNDLVGGFDHALGHFRLDFSLGFENVEHR